MKNLLMILAVVLGAATFTGSAQEKGQMAAGVNFDIGLAYSSGYSNFGLGAKYLF